MADVNETLRHFRTVNASFTTEEVKDLILAEVARRAKIDLKKSGVSASVDLGTPLKRTTVEIRESLSPEYTGKVVRAAGERGEI